MTLETRRLGASDLDLTVVGLGTWQFGGRWGGADDADSAAACHAALDSGINWIDTADIYGQGRAETIVGKVVRERRDDVIVATKGGVAWEFGDQGLSIWREATGEYLRMSLERSLTALQMDRVDLYMVHWPVAGVPADDTMAELAKLRDEGKIRWIGVSNYHLSDLEAAHAVEPFVSLQVGYHAMRPQVEQAELPWCEANNVGVLAYGPLAHGLLTGRMDEHTTFPDNDWRAVSSFFVDEYFAERVGVVRELQAIADASGRPGGVAELAVAWVLRNPVVTTAIIGARNAQQAEGIAALAARPLTADEDAAIAAVLRAHPNAAREYGHGEPPPRPAA
jgi:aryl-alcohol dehydrogenase-like predicted oxidoreductase